MCMTSYMRSYDMSNLYKQYNIHNKDFSKMSVIMAYSFFLFNADFFFYFNLLSYNSFDDWLSWRLQSCLQFLLYIHIYEFVHKPIVEWSFCISYMYNFLIVLIYQVYIAQDEY
jgi:hypothetical protein